MKFRPAAVLPRKPMAPVPRVLGQQNRVAIRMEVKNVAGDQFIPNAGVSLAFEDGTHILTKLTDAGGNVSFTEKELVDAMVQAGLSGVDGVVWYTVEAPGYQMAEDIIWDPGITTLQTLREVKTVALAPAANGDAGKPNYIAAGVTTALLIAVGLA